MRILHIITGLSDGGAEAVLFRLCTQDQEHDHHVVSLMDEGKYGPMLAAKNIPVTTLGMPRGRIRMRGLWQLFLLIRLLRPNAIQTWMYHADLIGGLVGRLAGQNNIIWGLHHTTLDSRESPRSTILVARLCSFLSKIVPSRIICCAERTYEIHGKLGYDRSRMRVIPNGYDLSVFRPDAQSGQEVRKELGISKDEPVMGFVARYDRQKDHETLLRALAILKPPKRCPKCLLVGTGLTYDNTELSTLIAALNLGDRVLLLGQRDDIPAIMNALDFHIMSSAFGEAFPNVLSEAMACGTPCISTDLGDSAAIIGETGLIIPPRDKEAMAAAIMGMLKEREGASWTELCDAARRHVADHFTIQSMVDSYCSVWFEGINRFARGPFSQREAK